MTRGIDNETSYQIALARSVVRLILRESVFFDHGFDKLIAIAANFHAWVVFTPDIDGIGEIDVIPRKGLDVGMMGIKHAAKVWVIHHVDEFSELNHGQRLGPDSH